MSLTFEHVQHPHIAAHRKAAPPKTTDEHVGFNGKVYFCLFIRLEVGDLSQSSLEEIWNGDTYVHLRKRLVERRLFPVCRRCCKVELERAC